VDENDEVPCVRKAAANTNIIVPKAGTIIMAKLAPRHRERSSEVANIAEFRRVTWIAPNAMAAILKVPRSSQSVLEEWSDRSLIESVFGASKLLGGLKRGPKFESHIVRLGIWVGRFTLKGHWRHSQL